MHQPDPGGQAHYSGKYINQDKVKAFEYLKRCSDKEHPQACFTVGLLYLGGEGVEKNYNEAFRFFKKAASYDYSYGYLYMGKMYMDKKLNIYDRDKAMNCIKYASELGNKQAIEVLKKWFDMK